MPVQDECKEVLPAVRPLDLLSNDRDAGSFVLALLFGIPIQMPLGSTVLFRPAIEGTGIPSCD